MRLSDAYPTRYLKAADIPVGSRVKVQIDRLDMEEISGNDSKSQVKPVLYFVGKEKGLVLNRTNASMISRHYGEETDEWQQRNLFLFQSETLFGGNTVPCLRVEVPTEDQRPMAEPDQGEIPF